MAFRQQLAAAAALGLIALSPGPAPAQPAGQTIRIIFPFAAGGGGDALARILAEQVQRATGNTTIVENRTGAAGRIGARAVKDSTPDGTTLLYTAFAMVTLYPHFYGDKLEFDPFVDFTPVSQPATFEFALGMAANVPAKDLKELTAWLKADSRRATVGIPAVGALPHFLGLAYGRAASVDMQVLPYKGSAAAVNDVAAGQVPLAITNTADLGELHRAGKLRIVGTFTEKRSAHVPDAPTFREQGLDIVGYGWYGVFAPAKTPRETVQRLGKILVDAVSDPVTRGRIAKLGLDPSGAGPEELAAIQKRDHDYWGPIIKASGFKPE